MVITEPRPVVKLVFKTGSKDPSPLFIRAWSFHHMRSLALKAFQLFAFCPNFPQTLLKVIRLCATPERDPPDITDSTVPVN